MKIEALKTLSKKAKAYSIIFEENETVEIISIKNNRINLLVKEDGINEL